VNEQTENIGARRLPHIMERVLEDVSFRSPPDVARRVPGEEAAAALQEAIQERVFRAPSIRGARRRRRPREGLLSSTPSTSSRWSHPW